MSYSDNPANLIHRRTAQRDRFRRVARYQRETLSATVDVLEQTRAELAKLRAWKPASTAFVSLEKYRAVQAERDAAQENYEYYERKYGELFHEVEKIGSGMIKADAELRIAELEGLEIIYDDGGK